MFSGLAADVQETAFVVLIWWIELSPDTLYLSTIGSTWFSTGWILGLLTISPTK